MTPSVRWVCVWLYASVGVRVYVCECACVCEWVCVCGVGGCVRTLTFGGGFEGGVCVWGIWGCIWGLGTYLGTWRRVWRSVQTQGRRRTWWGGSWVCAGCMYVRGWEGVYVCVSTYLGTWRRVWRSERTRGRRRTSWGGSWVRWWSDAECCDASALSEASWSPNYKTRGQQV